MNKGSTDNWTQVKTDSIAALPQTVVEHIRKVTLLPHSESHLISTLHKLQESLGYLGTTQLDAIAQLMQIPAAKVLGVASFYHFFRLKKTGRFIINVCMGTACYMKGATAVADTFTRILGINIGESTPDGMFTLQKTRCLGVCSLAPVAMINDEIHAHLKPELVSQILDKYRTKTSVNNK